ncbi:hypothetical protein ACFQ60_05500 [Streptomyces zhihengii]|uniref:Uncharacterized protein n=1 Tax=Streptomyces zhihengii TaxID=1818004 RepID=A0ABS2V1K6_9ACTN|nr:hypothetical protein [Streptomyces zhihengii]MBM9623711.1 hypothetical protein [Streptomyces zhihengii]
MLVRTGRLAKVGQERTRVRVHTPVGVAEVVWCGDPREADGHHHVEWTVDDDVHWGVNTVPAGLSEPGLWQEGDRVVMRGRFHLVEGGAWMQMGVSPILLDVVPPIADGADGAWVELAVASDRVTLWPYLI